MKLTKLTPTKLTPHKLIKGFGTLALVMGLVITTPKATALFEEYGRHDYPTQARGEYIFACMISNETSPEFLRKCSCAIDVIALHLPYDTYERGEALARIHRGNSPREEAYRSVNVAQDILKELFQAQAAAELECF